MPPRIPPHCMPRLPRIRGGLRYRQAGADRRVPRRIRRAARHRPWLRAQRVRAELVAGRRRAQTGDRPIRRPGARRRHSGRGRQRERQREGRVDEGFFDDVDIALCAHPASGGNHLSSRNLACQPVDIEFKGKAPHASGSPELGINALDGVIQTFNSINALRQHLPKDVRVHGIITDGGGLPNVVPDYVKAKFYLRSASVPGLNALRRKVENIVAGAALATGAKGSLTPYQHQVDNMIPTPLFDEVWERNAVSLGQRVEDRSGQGQLRLERRRQRLAGGAHDPALVRHLSGAARRAQRPRPASSAWNPSDGRRRRWPTPRSTSSRTRRCWTPSNASTPSAWRARSRTPPGREAKRHSSGAYGGIGDLRGRIGFTQTSFGDLRGNTSVTDASSSRCCRPGPLISRLWIA